MLILSAALLVMSKYDESLVNWQVEARKTYIVKEQMRELNEQIFYNQAQQRQSSNASTWAAGQFDFSDHLLYIDND